MGVGIQHRRRARFFRHLHDVAVGVCMAAPRRDLEEDAVSGGDVRLLKRDEAGVRQDVHVHRRGRCQVRARVHRFGDRFAVHVHDLRA